MHNIVWESNALRSSAKKECIQLLVVYIFHRSLGVSNFGVHHLKALSELGLEQPSVNQIQIHPWYQNTDIVRYCQRNNIAIIGYSPLAKAKKIDDETILDIAKKFVNICQI